MAAPTPDSPLNAPPARRGLPVLFGALAVTIALVVAGTVWQVMRGVSPGRSTAEVVSTLRSMTATAQPRPIGERRVATGARLIQNKGEPMQLCAGRETLAGTCSLSIAVVGVTWDQISWAAVEVIGVLSQPGALATLAVEQIGPVGTFLVSSDDPARIADDAEPPTYEAMRAAMITLLDTHLALEGSLVGNRSIVVLVLANTAEYDDQMMKTVRSRAPGAELVITPQFLTIR